VICFKRWLVIALVGTLWSCDSTPANADGLAELSQVQRIVNKAIIFHGGDKLSNAKLAFRFRDWDYTVERSHGRFTYTASHKDSAGVHVRTLTNEGYAETLDAAVVSLSPKDSTARAGTVNSVVYFTLLPVFLNDPAAYKAYQGIDTVGGKTYHRIEVTFDPDGGGTDHDDVYLYWFDTDSFRMDFLAYSFHVNGGGTRLRRAVNSRRVNGILFQDYENYRGPSPDSLAHIAAMYDRGGLDLLSGVALTNLAVSVSGDGN
jgi:hypothetical protein